MRIKFTDDNNWTIKSRGTIVIFGMALAVLSFFAVITSGTINGAEAQSQQERRPNVITITGTTSDEHVTINEENKDSEICTRKGMVVRGSGVTFVGETSSCNVHYHAWDISPNPDGVDTRYRVEGNGFSTGNGPVDSVEVHDGSGRDNDVYSLDANRFLMFDGPGDDTYRLVGGLVLPQSVSYSDQEGSDRVTFVERE